MLQPELNKAEALVMRIRQYIATEVELFKLNATAKISTILSNLIAAVFVTLFFLFFMLFASLALAWFIGEAVGSIWVGLLIVSGIYLLLGILAWISREKLLKIPIMNGLLSQIYQKDEPEGK